MGIYLPCEEWYIMCVFVFYDHLIFVSDGDRRTKGVDEMRYDFHVLTKHLNKLLKRRHF